MTDRIYIERLVDKNVGPIADIDFTFPFLSNGDPKPVIFVGENGTGKTTLISNIVDAFYEMARKAFDNADYPDERSGYQYFKTIAPLEIRIGESFLYSYISFSAKNELKYVFKTGKISADNVKEQVGENSDNITWKENENKKIITGDKATITDIWAHNVICYMGPDRYEKPAWMGDKYYQTDEFLHPTVRNGFEGKLKNPIDVKNVTSLNLQWLLDVIADSRADVEVDAGSLRLLPSTNVNNIILLKQARNNLETILSNIIGDDVCFQLNYRNSGGSRFRIIKKSDNNVVCPTLDSLSTGQIALFNMFATIIRYADNNDINHSIHLSNITGIVIIDEIDIHLHTKLQKEVLPALIKLFPKIQFVITTHSPLFLLGMKETFGEECFEVVELPNAAKISTEKFSEFKKAYEYLKKSDMYHYDVKKALDAMRSHNKAIIVTEGSTDWKHLEAAYESLKKEEQYQSLFDNLEFEFFKYEPLERSEDAKHTLEMGNSVLIALCTYMAKLPQSVKYIFIADRDDENTNKKMSVQNKPFKDWGNNVFSFVLPVPPHRKDTPAISIEHYYTDDEIKTEWDDPNTGISYRLYMGNEFDERGLAPSIDRFCEKRSKCGKASIAIIEGSSGEKVTSICDNNGINYALPKSKFSKMILDKQAPFDSFNFDSFIPIFETIKSITEEKLGKQNS